MKNLGHQPTANTRVWIKAKHVDINERVTKSFSRWLRRKRGSISQPRRTRSTRAHPAENEETSNDTLPIVLESLSRHTIAEPTEDHRTNNSRID